MAGWASGGEYKARILVITNKNRDEVNLLGPGGPHYDIAVVQTTPGTLTHDQSDSLMAWVAAGGTLWFHDSRLADRFGMTPDPLSAVMFECQKAEAKDVFGLGAPTAGALAVAVPSSDYATGTGVSRVQVFLPEVDTLKYSAVKVEPGVASILKVDDEPRAVAAVKMVGTGMVVFKPLLYKQFDWERMQGNLIEFSCGRPVPSLTAKEQARPPGRLDLVILRNGATVKGTIVDKDLSFLPSNSTSYVEVNASSVKEVVIGLPNGFDQLTTNDGRVQLGMFMSAEVVLQTDWKSRQTFSKADIASVVFDAKL